MKTLLLAIVLLSACAKFQSAADPFVPTPVTTEGEIDRELVTSQIGQEAKLNKIYFDKSKVNRPMIVRLTFNSQANTHLNIDASEATNVEIRKIQLVTPKGAIDLKTNPQTDLEPATQYAVEIEAVANADGATYNAIFVLSRIGEEPTRTLECNKGDFVYDTATNEVEIGGRPYIGEKQFCGRTVEAQETDWILDMIGTQIDGKHADLHAKTKTENYHAHLESDQALDCDVDGKPFAHTALSGCALMIRGKR